MRQRLLPATVLALVTTIPLVAPARVQIGRNGAARIAMGIRPTRACSRSGRPTVAKLLWKATGLGIGYTNVSVVGDRIFTMGDKDDASFAMALKLADGKPLWTAKVGKAGAPGWGGFAGPRCTPTVDGDLVFAVGQYGEVAVLRRRQRARKFGEKTTSKISAANCRSGAIAACRWSMASK